MLLSEAKLHYNSHVDNGRVQKFTQSQEISAKIYAGSKIPLSGISKKKKNRRKYAPEDIVRFLCCVGLVAGVGHDPTTSGL